MAFTGLRKIAGDLKSEGDRLLDSYLVTRDPEPRDKLMEFLWDNKVGLLCCAQFTNNQAAADSHPEPHVDR